MQCVSPDRSRRGFASLTSVEDFPGRRSAPGSIILGLGLASLLLAGSAPGQGFQRGDASLFSLPRSQDENFELRKAQEDLEAARTAESRRANELIQGSVERLHRLITEESRGVIQVGVGRHHGLYGAVLSTLRELSPEAKEAYEALVRREAGALLRRPLTELSREQLMELADGFPAADVGRRARGFLGDLALEAGRGAEAAQHYRAALDATRHGSKEAGSLNARMKVALVLAHPPQYAHRSEPRMDPETVDRVMEVLPSGGDQTWPNYAGGGAGTRPMEAPPGSPDSKFELNVTAPGFDQNNFAMHAVGDLGAIYITNGQRVYAVSPLGREVTWIGDGPMVGETHFYEGIVNPDMVLSAAVGDQVVVAALQVPDETENIVFRRGMAIVNQIPERRLFAFDRSTGKRLWGHWDHLNGPLDRAYRGQVPSSPPLIHGDTIYVANHDPRGTIAFYLSAYELNTGELRWRRLLCSSQQEVNMFGNANMEFAASPLSMHGGVLYGSTNLGLCYAADAATGRIRWLSEYDVVPLPPSRGRYRGNRTVFFANNAPVIADGVVVCTPLDSYNALAFDIDTGQLQWRLNYLAKASGDNKVRWLLGAVDDEFIFSGMGVVAVKARSQSDDLRATVRQVLAPEQEIMRFPVHMIPRGSTTENLIFHPTPRGLRIVNFRGEVDPEISTGAALPARLGNLLMVDGILVSVSGDDNEMVHVTYDPESLLRRAETRAKRDSDDVVALYRQAALLRAAARNNVEGPQGDLAESVYRQGLDVAKSQGMGPGSPLWTRLSREWFELTVERAKSRARREPLEAVNDLRVARKEAPDEEAWLDVQMLILEHSRQRPVEYLGELDLMASRFGRQRRSFPEVGTVPVQAYALWLGTQVEEEPEEAVHRCQQILESFTGEQFHGQSLQDLASIRLKELLDTHGHEVYASIEARAEQTLALAGSDPQLLHSVATRFPHSRSADRAMGLLLDLAAESGDLGAAADAYSKAVAGGQESSGLLRRMMIAAERGGNLALAGTIAQRILTRDPAEVSDYPPDGGQTYGDVVVVPEPPATAVQEPVLPAFLQGQIEPRVFASNLKMVPVTPVEGFPNPVSTPLYVAVNAERLTAYELDERGAPSDTPLFTVDVNFCERVLLCGTTLVVPDMNRVRGMNYRTGEELWEIAAQENRVLDSLGVHSGVLHVFSVHRSAGDGGELLGLEPLTGHVLFRRVFPPLRVSTPPRVTGAQILLVESYAGNENAWIHRIDPVTGNTTVRIPILRDLRGLLELKMGVIRQPMFVKRMFADERHVYVPVNPPSTNGPPRLAALRNDGSASWVWAGKKQRTFLMHAQRGDRVVIVEGANPVGSRVAILNARTGEPVQERELIGLAKVLNWELTPQPDPAPEALLVTDMAPSLRLTCLSLADRIRPFQTTLHRLDLRVLRNPTVGEDFVAFGVQRRNTPQLLLYVLDLESRNGALPDSKKYLSLPPELRRPYEIKRHGPYTVVQSSDALTVFSNR